MPIYALGARTPTLHDTAYVFETAVVIGDVRLAEFASVWPGAILRGDNDTLTIGRRSNVQDGAVLHTDQGLPLTLGENVSIGHQAMLHGCQIGDGTLIGMQAIVLNGARIGKGCLIGAGALVPEGREIPDNSLVLGSPGKVARVLTPEDANRIARGADHYVERILQYRNELRRLS